MADQIAVGLYQARLHAQLARHAEDLERQVAARTAQLAQHAERLHLAAEIARDATAARSLDELLRRAADLIRERFGLSRAALYLVDDEREYALVRAWAAAPEVAEAAPPAIVRVGSAGPVGEAMLTARPARASAPHAHGPRADSRAEVALPLRVGGVAIGALALESAEASAFDELALGVLGLLADQLAVAIERTRLFEQTEATLAESLQTVVAHTPVVLAAIDRTGIITLLEGKGLALLGEEPARLVGRSLFEVCDELPAVVEGYFRALAGSPADAVIHHAGHVLDMRCFPRRDESGEVTGVIALATDITERVQMEVQMHRQERLAAVGQLAGGIAHDFNNFLTTIIIYARLLMRDRNLLPQHLSAAETIVTEAQHAAQLVRQLLDFSRRSAMETQPVDLTAFVGEVVNLLRKTLAAHIRLSVETEPHECVAIADPTRIQQVLMNLALNAQDAMPHGGELRIGLARVGGASGKALPDPDVPAGEWLCLTVGDTGSGMTEEVQAHLFEPFFTTKGAKGTGLGLAQVYGIVEQHNGHIRWETALGRGTTFRIYLPAAALSPAEATEPPVALAAVPRGQGETILLAEDEDSVREACRQVLTELGYRVLAAADGRQALEMARSADQVHLLVTDVVMPHLGGRDLIGALRETRPGLRAVVMTGYALGEEMAALRAEGVAEIIQKPLDVGVLANCVRRALDAPSSGGGASAAG